jgi:acyl-CoA thioesterase-1
MALPNQHDCDNGSGMLPYFLRSACHVASGFAAVLVCVSVMAVARADPSVAVRHAELLPHVAARLAAHAPLRIIVLGSSSTEGAGATSAAASYPSRLLVELRAALPADETVTVLNRGIGGQDADDMARRVPGIIAEHPDLVIWQTGTNDALRAMPLAHFVDLTRAGVLAMRHAGIDVMLMGPQLCQKLESMNGSLRYRDALRSMGAEMDAPMIDRFDLMHAWLASGLLTSTEMLSSDGLHMTDGGYALLAREVSREILAGAGRGHAMAAMVRQLP